MKRWYVAHTRAQSERRALEHLTNQGFEAWLPEFHKRRRHARRTEWVRRPLFPRYVFVHLDLDTERWRSVLGTVGIQALIGGADRPTPIADAVIEAIRARVDQDGLVRINPADTLKSGETVRIADGPFADLEGIFLDMADNERVAVLLSLLGRNVKVTVSADQVERP